MSYDIRGTEPSASEGVYFHRSNRAWPPLAAICRELVPEFADQCKHWVSTQGAGLSAEGAAKLAERLQRLIVDGTIADYISQMRVWLARMPDEICAACDGAGCFPRAMRKTVDKLFHPVIAGGSFICRVCVGVGYIRPFVACYLLDEADVKEWIAFLCNCGGFSID